MENFIRRFRSSFALAFLVAVAFANEGLDDESWYKVYQGKSGIVVEVVDSDSVRHEIVFNGSTVPDDPNLRRKIAKQSLEKIEREKQEKKDREDDAYNPWLQWEPKSSENSRVQEEQIKMKERTALEGVFHALVGPYNVPSIEKWLNASTDHCSWKGVTCHFAKFPKSPDDNESNENSTMGVSVVTSLSLPSSFLTGSIPGPALKRLEFLTVLQLSHNNLVGTIPEFLSQLHFVHLQHNSLIGKIPKTSARVQELLLQSNQLTGSLLLAPKSQLRLLDISDNALSGTLPKVLSGLTNLHFFIGARNFITGSLPDLRKLKQLKTLDLMSNMITGTIQGMPKHLWDLNLANNELEGSFPKHLFSLTEIQSLILSENLFSHPLPSNSTLWSKFDSLGVLKLDGNGFVGGLPLALIRQQASNLKLLDLSYNKLSGTIATELGMMTKLDTITLTSNAFYGTIPNEMTKMNMNLRLNFTNNQITGTIPGMFCGDGASSMNMLYQEFGCDAVLCRAGTFSNHGHATLHSACRPCPALAESKLLGQIECKDVDFVHGDLNGDGILQAREILRMIYVDTLGRFWGPAFQQWADMKVNECNLLGITCVNGEIARIDLSSAEMCSNGDRRPGPTNYCKGIPPEIGQLSGLEVLQLTRRQFLRGTIPTEIGRLTRLRLLDFSTCASMTGEIPSEIGNLKGLKRLMLSHSRFQGPLPLEIFNLTALERLHLTNNMFTSTIPTFVGQLEGLKELMISRNKFSGTIPSELGKLKRLENLEAYHNYFSGTLPPEIATKNIKRIDVFGNILTGTIPHSLSSAESLQIFHVKDNQLDGTIPNQLAELPQLTWFDISQNLLHGTIPVNFGSNLEDFRLSGNRLYGKIPQTLCQNFKVNGGATKEYGCDGIACPAGSSTPTGHAFDGHGCSKCPNGMSNMYLGSTSCEEMNETDILTALFEVVDGSAWSFDNSKHWGDASISVCDWAGVHCDRQASPRSLGIPLIRLDDTTY